MRRPTPLSVFLIIVCAATALGVTFYFGMQRESATVLPKRPTASAPVKITPPAPLRVWTIASPEGTALLQSAIAAWQPDFPQRIELRVFPGRVEYETARILATQDRQLPDVFWVSADEIDALDQSQLLVHVPLSSVQPGAWLPQILSPFMREGELMAYPAQYSVLALYYNRRIFDQVGIAYPDTPWNWETLVSISRALYKPPQGGKPARFSLEWTPTLDLWNALSAQAGGPLYEGRNWLLNVRAPAASPQKEALQFLIDLQQSYTFNAPATGPGRPTSFEKGECAMILAGPEFRAVLKGQPDLQWGVAPIPDRYALEPERCTRATPLRLGGWGVSAKSSQSSKAMLLADRLSTVALDGWLPARRDGVASGLDAEGTAVFVQALARALPPFAHPQGPRVSQSLDNLLVTLRNAPTNVDKFMAKVDVALEGIDLRPPATIPPKAAAIPPAPAPAPSPAPAP